jgi:signal peptidase I
MPHATEPSPAPPSKTRAKRRGFFYALFTLGAAALCCCNPISLALGLRGGVAEAFEIEGPAMAPAYQAGDRVFALKAYGLFPPFARGAWVSWGEPEVGEVVVAHVAPDEVDIVKRVVGVGGDTIAIQDDVVLRNGVPFARRELGPVLGARAEDAGRCVEERVGDRRWTVIESGDWIGAMDPVRIPAGHVFLLGDNRHQSNDSRNPQIGAVPTRRIKARVTTHYFFATDRLRCPEP